MNEKLVELHKEAEHKCMETHNYKCAALLTESLMQEFDIWKWETGWEGEQRDRNGNLFYTNILMPSHPPASFSDLFAEFMNQYKTKNK